MLRYTRVVLADRSVYGHQAARALPQRNKAIPFSPCPGEHPGIPCWSRPAPGMQPRARACHAHAALVPKAMEAARGQPPLDLPAPGHSLGMGGKLDAALPGVKQVRTHILKGCRNSSAICPPSFQHGIWILIHKHRSKPCARHPPMPLFWWKQGFHRCNVPFPALQQQGKESIPKSEF